MRKAMHAVCISWPLVLTTASLILLMLVMAGQLSSNNKAPVTSVGRDLYFLKADTTQFIADPRSLFGRPNGVGDRIGISTGPLDEISGSVRLNDFYLIGLWSYCEGQKSGDVEEITYCSSPKFQFWFDPTDVWGINPTILQEFFGDKLHGELYRYSNVMGWMNCAFVSAVVLIAAELVWCLLCFSRTGSLIVWIVCVASSVFAIAAATTATITYVTLDRVFHTVLGPYMIDISVGKEMFVSLWFGVAAGVVSGPLWLLSGCC